MHTTAGLTAGLTRETLAALQAAQAGDQPPFLIVPPSEAYSSSLRSAGAEPLPQIWQELFACTRSAQSDAFLDSLASRPPLPLPPGLRPQGGQRSASTAAKATRNAAAAAAAQASSGTDDTDPSLGISRDTVFAQYLLPEALVQRHRLGKPEVRRLYQALQVVFPAETVQQSRERQAALLTSERLLEQLNEERQRSRVLEQENAALRQQVEGVVVQMLAVQADASLAQQSVAGLQAQLRAAQQERAAQQAQGMAARRELLLLQDKMAALSGPQDQLFSQVQQLERVVRDKQAELSAVGKQASAALAGKEEAQQAARSEQLRREAAEQRAEQLQEALNQATLQLRAAQAAAAAREQQDAAEAAASKERAAAEAAAREDDTARLATARADAERRATSAEGDAAALRQQLEAAQQQLAAERKRGEELRDRGIAGSQDGSFPSRQRFSSPVQQPHPIPSPAPDLRGPAAMSAAVAPASTTAQAAGAVETVLSRASSIAAEIDRKERFMARSDFAFMFHAFALLFYVRTWMWHTTPAAAGLPGAQGFGWFFRYLTFCSYTLQMVQLAVCCMAHVSRQSKRKRRLTELADQLSCALFGIANTVTALFFAIEKSTNGLVEGGAADRPAWLNMAVHVVNSLVAWLDLLIVEERSFEGSSRHLALLFAVAYCTWLLVVRQRFGKFPYPILNNLPFPLGFAFFVLLGFVVVLFTFQLGKAVKTLLGGSNSSSSINGSGSGGGKGGGTRRRRSSGGGWKKNKVVDGTEFEAAKLATKACKAHDLLHPASSRISAVHVDAALEALATPAAFPPLHGVTTARPATLAGAWASRQQAAASCAAAITPAAGVSADAEDVVPRHMPAAVPYIPPARRQARPKPSHASPHHRSSLPGARSRISKRSSSMGVKKGLQPLLHTVRVVMRNGASFNLQTTMRRSTPYMLQADTTTNPVYTGEAAGLSLEDQRMQRLLSKYEGFVEEGAGADIATGSGAAPSSKAAPPLAAKGKGKKK
ncbi:Leucine Rich Repeat isoform B [Chlorella sorokiniana]|uniref:Leucine Rich Repeat isoform B n=1 Tax=Chlorella sorokiniana TaxID=3076 RepID=A0A2P6TE04_CHLSO|nr:Leucine Rich Repeat isoform B [Chlorella sorokiniana]|eukprot:PRW20871.1 Leucine Rich Repeat isoform B [Chlorella sorokiniana]